MNIQVISALQPGRETEGALLAPTAVAAGFPSPADQYFEGRIDLNTHLMGRDPSSTFIVRVSGDSMTGAGISDGDELVVDRSIIPVDGNVVVAIIDGELTVKRLRYDGAAVRLAAENPDYPDVHISEHASLSIWGTVTRCLHHV